MTLLEQGLARDEPSNKAMHSVADASRASPWLCQAGQNTQHRHDTRKGYLSGYAEPIDQPLRPPAKPLNMDKKPRIDDEPADPFTIPNWIVKGRTQKYNSYIRSIHQDHLERQESLQCPSLAQLPRLTTWQPPTPPMSDTGQSLNGCNREELEAFQERSWRCSIETGKPTADEIPPPCFESPLIEDPENSVHQCDIARTMPRSGRLRRTQDLVSRSFHCGQGDLATLARMQQMKMRGRQRESDNLQLNLDRSEDVHSDGATTPGFFGDVIQPTLSSGWTFVGYCNAGAAPATVTEPGSNDVAAALTNIRGDELTGRKGRSPLSTPSQVGDYANSGQNFSDEPREYVPIEGDQSQRSRIESDLNFDLAHGGHPDYFGLGDLACFAPQLDTWSPAQRKLLEGYRLSDDRCHQPWQNSPLCPLISGPPKKRGPGKMIKAGALQSPYPKRKQR